MRFPILMRGIGGFMYFMALVSTMASLILIFDTHWSVVDGSINGHIGLWAFCANNVCVPYDPGWGATFVKVATLFGVTWMLLVIAVTGLVPMSTNNVCKAFSLGFRGKAMVNIGAAITYVSWVRVESINWKLNGEGGLSYTQSSCEYAMIGLGVFDMIMGVMTVVGEKIKPTRTEADMEMSQR